MSMVMTILSYNHPELTARAVRSALRHQGPELIHLVHNGSREACKTELLQLFPQIQHHVLAENKGYTGGVNFALEGAFAVADWALFITNDCELEKVGECPSIPGLYAPRIEVRKTGRVDSLGGAINLRNGRLKHCRSIDEWESESLRYVPGTAFLLHKSVFDQVGKFDERLHTYWEDVDFSRRVEKNGFALGVKSDFVLHHGVGKTCHKDPHYTTYLYQRNRRTISRRLAKEAGVKWPLEFFLWKDYFSGSYRLARARRWTDLRRLAKAHFNSFA